MQQCSLLHGYVISAERHFWRPFVNIREQHCFHCQIYGGYIGSHLDLLISKDAPVASHIDFCCPCNRLTENIFSSFGYSILCGFGQLDVCQSTPFCRSRCHVFVMLALPLQCLECLSLSTINLQHRFTYCVQEK